MKLFKSVYNDKLVLWFFEEEQLKYLRSLDNHLANLGASFRPIISDDDNFVRAIAGLAKTKIIKLELFAIDKPARDRTMKVLIMELE